MLPRKQRLTAKILQKIFTFGKKKTFPEFTIYYLDNVYSYPRVNVIVPKSLTKKAVIRNRLKRRLRHILQSLIKEKKIAPKDYLFVVKSIKLQDEEFTHIKEKIIKYLHEISD